MKFNVACIQLTCSDQLKENLESIIKISHDAIKAGADFIVTPENSSLFTVDKKSLFSKSESFEKNSFIESIPNTSLPLALLPDLPTGVWRGIFGSRFFSHK